MIFGHFVNQLSFRMRWHADKWLHRWVMSALQSVMTTSQQLQLTLSTGWDQTIQEQDSFSSRAWPEEIKLEVGLMPAGTVNLLFIFNLLDHLRLFKRSLSRKKIRFWHVNYWGFTVIRMIAPINPPCELPGVKDFFRDVWQSKRAISSSWVY